MTGLLATLFVVIFSSYYGDALWSGSKFGDWAKGMSPCETCKHVIEEGLIDLVKARNYFVPGYKEDCDTYPTPEGSCDSYIKVLETSFDLLIERQNKSQELCAYYGLCKSNLTLDISLPDIPVAPVTPKQNPPKVYNNAVCGKCTRITAALTFMGIGNYADSFAARAENDCSMWTKTGPVSTKEDVRKCYDLNSVYFNPITDNLIDKTTQNYLCWDLFDVCEPSQKPNEVKLPYGQKSTH